MAHSSKARSAVFLILAAAVLAAVVFPWGEEEAAAGGPPAGGGGFRLPVTFAEVEAGTVTESVELVGDVLSARRAVLSFERSGRVERVLADLGDFVKAGDVLARLDDAVLQQEVAVAAARALAYEAEADLAQKEAARGREMGTELITAEDQERRVAQAEAAEHRAAEQRANEQRLEAQLAQGELRAPFDAIVSSRQITDGTFVGLGDVAFELVDLRNREVHLEIPAPVAAELGTSAALELRADDLPGFRIQSHLDKLVVAADPQSRLFTGVVRIAEEDPEGKLMPGMFVRARLVRKTVASNAVVPSDAMLETPRGTVVYRIDPPPAVEGGEGGPGGMPPAPTAALVPVQVLARNAERAAVAPFEPGALKAGDQVVVTGVDNVFPSAPLLPSPHRAVASPDAPSPEGGRAASAPSDRPDSASPQERGS